ncbi:hypothetical protein GCM10011498_00220 [Amylibacter cionae]|uniref:Uncharacterized protein n=1 Tax=Neptunicoccus cionae TaxID=2035344 RepID=A0A916QQW6_9RHOB|nr:hypothetical protein GCM10011498_00220 [Amylibacter cionae]
MRAAASLHRNNARVQTFQKVQQPVPLKALAVHDRACCVQSRKATNGLAQINALYFNTDQNAPLSPPMRATIAAVWQEDSSSH